MRTLPNNEDCAFCIFAKGSLLNLWLGSEYAFVIEGDELHWNQITSNFAIRPAVAYCITFSNNLPSFKILFPVKKRMTEKALVGKVVNVGAIWRIFQSQAWKTNKQKTYPEKILYISPKKIFSYISGWMLTTCKNEKLSQTLGWSD